MKSVYFRNLIEDIYRYKIIVSIFILFCTALFAIMGYRKAISDLSLNTQQQNEVNEYNERLTEYDTTIADIENSLKLTEQQINILQKYIDNSIFMKIDSQNIQTASVQYAIHSEGNVGNILSSLTLYVNEGGLKEDISNEYDNFKTEYWKDIVFCSSNGNIFSVTVIHYDAEIVNEILNIIKVHLQEQVDRITAVQGSFSLSELDSSLYTKADINVANSQNSYLNSLKNYTTNRSELNSKLISQQNGKASYIEKNKPESHPNVEVNKTSNTIKYTVAGILFGVMIPCICFMLQYILGNRIRSARDLEYYQIPILNISSELKGYSHSLERSLIDIKLLLDQNQFSSLYLSALSNQSSVRKTVSDYKIVTEQAGIPSEQGFNALEDANELQQMISIKNCILFIKAGKDTYPQLEQHINICRSFKIDILGCIVIL